MESTSILLVKEKEIQKSQEDIKDLEQKLCSEKATNISQKAELEAQATKVQEIEATLRTKENGEGVAT